MFKSDLSVFILKSLLSGFLIGFGCLVFVVTENRYVGSFLFALGLLTIILKQYNLYTGQVGYWTPNKTLRLLSMFVLNAIGAYCTSFIFSLSRVDTSNVQNLVATKLADSYLSLFILAIGCGAMMHIAVYLFKRGKHPLYVIMPIMFFILCSFEHCVADAGYFGMAHVVPNLDVLGRLFTMVIGNGIGSLILTKFVEDPKEA